MKKMPQAEWCLLLGSMERAVKQIARKKYGRVAAARAFALIDEAYEKANHSRNGWEKTFRYLRTRATRSSAHGLAFQLYVSYVLAIRDECYRREGSKR